MKLIHSTSDKVILELPYPPSLNALYKPNRFGQTYLTKEGKDYKNDVKLFLDQNKPYKFETEDVVLIYRIHRGDNRKKWDCDNLNKILADSLSMRTVKDKDGNKIPDGWYLWKDDSQAQFMLPLKGDVWKDRKCVEVSVMRSDTPEAQHIISTVNSIFAAGLPMIANKKS